MHSLINILGDHAVFDIGCKKQKIKIAGTYENPYFCGKDVCTLLEYTDVEKALVEHVKPKNKKDLQTIYQESCATRRETPEGGTCGAAAFGGGREAATIKREAFDGGTAGATNTKLLNNNNEKAIYINEAGLYSLIMYSHVAFSEKFQDFVHEQILPTIRKTGKYQLKKTTVPKNDDKGYVCRCDPPPPEPNTAGPEGVHLLEAGIQGCWSWPPLMGGLNVRNSTAGTTVFCGSRGVAAVRGFTFGDSLQPKTESGGYFVSTTESGGREATANRGKAPGGTNRRFAPIGAAEGGSSSGAATSEGVVSGQ
jgi:prophage antirepressor-like protein